MVKMPSLVVEPQEALELALMDGLIDIVSQVMQTETSVVLKLTN
jgi:hypothetical protein